RPELTWHRHPPLTAHGAKRQGDRSRQVTQKRKRLITTPRLQPIACVTEKLNKMRKVEGCHGAASSPICLLVKLRAPQFFFVAAIAALLIATYLHGALSSGAIYSFNFVDLDGEKLSTADGHVTVLVLTTAADREKVRAVGDRVPDYCLGNPNYRMITVIRFTSKHTAIGRKIATALVKHRVNEEAKRLQSRYNANKISRDARQDIFTVLDFDGTASSQLDESRAAASFRVLVFARDGKLLAQWTDVPSAKQLADVLK